MIGNSIAHYKVIAKVGAGGMGEVYRATDSKLGRDVALKVLPQEFAADAQRMARFQREAQLLASLNHPNIAAIYGLEHQGNIQALAMELVEGPTLSERLALGPLAIEEALPIARQIAEALEYAHERGIIHRDLKPANVKLTHEGKAKVLDFGLAKALQDDTGASDISTSPTLSIAATRAGVILGTAAYMSPEQARGKAADRRADIWAFGVVLYEMLSGRQLYGGETVSDSMAAVITREPDWTALPAGISPRVRELLRRCLTKDPRQRLRDIGEARIAVEEILANPAAEMVAEGAPRGTVSPGKSSRLGWWMAGVSFLAALALGALYVRLALRELPVIRAEIPPPPDGAFFLFTTHPGPVVISPDGTTLAYVGVDKDNTPRLYVRPLNATEARAVPGTEGAGYPFWSPDSRWIAFYGGNKLKKVDLNGGPPVALCDGTSGKSGTWNRDGVILYSPSFDAVIHRTTAEGGGCAPITKFDEKRGDNSHRHPRFLPDGKHFLYFVRSSRSEQGAHYVIIASLDSKEEKALMQSETMVEYVNGQLLFLREHTLVARPFDAGRLEFTGEAVPLAENVLSVSAGAGAAGFSVSHTGVLVHHFGGLRLTNQLVWLDREGKQGQALREKAVFIHVALSPDARAAAVVLSEQNTGAVDLWLYDLKRDLMTRFTFGAAAEQTPIWSPDGNTLYYSARKSGKSYDLFRKTVAGSGEEELLLESPEDKVPTGCTPDGKYLLYWTDSSKVGVAIWALPLTGERKPELLLSGKFGYWGGTVSPDGKWMAFLSDEGGRTQVFVTSFPKPGRKWQVTKNGASIAFWRRDGKEILYQSPEGRMFSVEVAARGESIELGAEKSLLLLPAFQDPWILYSPAADHQRFLTVSGVSAQPKDPLRLVYNWPALLKK